jgi:hypothetical protein
MKSFQFNLTDGIADQPNNYLWFSTCLKVVNCNVIKKIPKKSLHPYVFHSNDIHDAFPLANFKFYLELEPVFEIFEKIFIY